MVTRTQIVHAAYAWDNTPYHHQASVRSVGCDCLGLVRGVWRDCFGTEPETPPPYTPNWAEDSGMETLLEAAARNLEARPVTDRKPGQIFFMRMKRGSPAKHCGIILNGSEIMHAYSGHKVTITQLTDWWDKLIVAVYDYPGVK